MDKSDLCLKCFCGSSDHVNSGTISVVSKAKTLKTPQLVITNVLFRQVLPHFICLPQGTWSFTLLILPQSQTCHPV